MMGLDWTCDIPDALPPSPPTHPPCRPYLSARMQMSLMALGFYFFPSLVEDVLSIFSCRQVCVLRCHLSAFAPSELPSSARRRPP
jgi:hypothetical protein